MKENGQLSSETTFNLNSIHKGKFTTSDQPKDEPDNTLVLLESVEGKKFSAVMRVWVGANTVVSSFPKSNEAKDSHFPGMPIPAQPENVQRC